MDGVNTAILIMLVVLIPLTFFCGILWGAIIQRFIINQSIKKFGFYKTRLYKYYRTELDK